LVMAGMRKARRGVGPAGLGSERGGVSMALYCHRGALEGVRAIAGRVCDR